MIHKLTDRFFKEMIECHAGEFIHMAFPDSQFKVESAQLDKEIIVRSQEVDKVLLLRTARGQQVIHMESYNCSFA
jgi:hypothetical protein